MTFPNGESMSLGDMNADSLQDTAGLSAADANKVMSDLDKFQKGEMGSGSSIASMDPILSCIQLPQQADAQNIKGTSSLFNLFFWFLQ